MDKYIDNFVLLYLYDIFVFSTTEHEHENHLGLIFQILREHKLQAKLYTWFTKLTLLKDLSHIVGSGEVKVDKDKVAAVASWEPPKDIKGI